MAETQETQGKRRRGDRWIIWLIFVLFLVGLAIRGYGYVMSNSKSASMTTSIPNSRV